MGPTQARLAFFAFLTLSAAVCVNALYFQTGRHPAPFSRVSGKAAPQTVSKRRASTQARRRTGARAPDGASAKTVRAIQRELTARSYDPGPVDGVAGPLTRGAIMAYQHDRRLGLSGEPDASLLRHILLGKSSNRNDLKAGPSTATVALIKNVQKVLAGLGYGPKAVDGLIGADTRKAIRTFERDRRIRGTGRISGKLLRELSRVTSADFAARD